VRYVESIRQRLSPKTATMINEVGAISADDGEQNQPGHVTKPIPNSYWNLCGAMYAYLFGELANMGIDTVNASQLVGYPTQYPSVSLVDWETGQPNARFWVLKLLKDHFGPGDKLVRTPQPGPFVYAQAFLRRQPTPPVAGEPAQPRCGGYASLARWAPRCGLSIRPPRFSRRPPRR
jgi:hypothetical protein